MRYAVPFGRLLFSLIFLMAGFSNFSHQAIQHAASAGVPLASLAVPVSGIVAFLGGLSILLGYRTRWGAWLIVLFLVPVTIMMHAFWNESDPMMRQMQMVNFMKNLALLGGALAFAYFGAGPVSIDEHEAHRGEADEFHAHTAPQH